MGTETQPVPTNPVSKTVGEIINAVVYDLAQTSFKVWARAQLPFLNLPVISQMFDWLMGLIIGNFCRILSRGSTFAVINFQTDLEKWAYRGAEAKLRAVHLGGDQNAISQATIEFKEALRALVRFDGTGPT
jgi:hypothetical protein